MTQHESEHAQDEPEREHHARGDQAGLAWLEEQRECRGSPDDRE